MDRKARSDLHQRRRRITRRPGSTEAVEFFNVLTGARVLETAEALLPVHRERLYPPTTTLSIFMPQTLEADAACQRAVNGWAAQRAADGLQACSVRTGGYCRARSASALAAGDGQCADRPYRPPSQSEGTCALAVARPSGQAGGWHRAVHARYPREPGCVSPAQQPGQRRGISAGSGLVKVICLATGAALDAAIGPHQGKGSGELGLVRQVLASLRRTGGQADHHDQPRQRKSHA